MSQSILFWMAKPVADFLLAIIILAAAFVGLVAWTFAAEFNARRTARRLKNQRSSECDES